MTIKFSGVTKHGAHEFHPGVALAFEGDRVEEYFLAAGWATETPDAPTRTYGAGEVEVDPTTVFGTGDNIGKTVLASDTE